MQVVSEQWKPRKAPKQERARFTVDSILEAGEKVIYSQGYDQTTTNRIAEVAGVSIGSLYQYFPNKEAIVSALMEKSIVETAQEIRQELLECMDLPLEISTPRLVRAILQARKKNAFVFLRLPREVPLYAKFSEQRSTEKFLYTTIYAYYMQHRNDVVIENLETAIFVTEHMVVGCIDAYLDNQSPKITEDELVEQLSRAVISYLTK